MGRPGRKQKRAVSLQHRAPATPQPFGAPNAAAHTGANSHPSSAQPTVPAAEGLPQPDTARPKAPSPAAPRPAASVQVSAGAGRNEAFRVKARSAALPALLLQIPTSRTGSPTLGCLRAGRLPGIRSLGTHLNAAQLELPGPQTQGRAFTHRQISAKEHAEPVPCQERFQSVLDKLFMIQEPQSWASERGSSTRRRAEPESQHQQQE